MIRKNVSINVEAKVENVHTVMIMELKVIAVVMTLKTMGIVQIKP